MNTINPRAATTAELVAFYNAHSNAAPVKKFQDRATAERRVTALLAELRFTPPTHAEYAECRDLAHAIPPNPLAERNPERLSLPELLKRDGSAAAGRGGAIAASWSDPTVKAARSKRDRVVVEGVGEFRSVKEAFLALGLPLAKHIKFRVALKADGERYYSGHNFFLASAAPAAQEDAQ